MFYITCLYSGIFLYKQQLIVLTTLSWEHLQHSVSHSCLAYKKTPGQLPRRRCKQEEAVRKSQSNVNEKPVYLKLTMDLVAVVTSVGTMLHTAYYYYMERLRTPPVLWPHARVDMSSPRPSCWNQPAMLIVYEWAWLMF